MNTINHVMSSFLENVSLARSANTARSYRNALQAFSLVLKDRGLDIENAPIQNLVEDAIAWFAADLKHYAPATEQLYLTAVMGLYEYIAAERLSEPNLPRLRMLIRQRARKPGQRLPQFPRNNIELVIDYVKYLTSNNSDDQNEKYRNLRDRAFLLTLADTGLRVHEACALRRGDLDLQEGKAIIIGKGNRQAIVRFSSRSIAALRDYLTARSRLDGASGRPLTSLPLFARHDRGAGNKVKPITTTTGRNIVSERVREILGESAVGSITPHSFRHYFVTMVLRASGGNLKLAQELARHQNIAITQRYAHLSDEELDQGYHEIFDQE
jgi:site-specific recombinase XerD